MTRDALAEGLGRLYAAFYKTRPSKEALREKAAVYALALADLSDLELAKGIQWCLMHFEPYGEQIPAPSVIRDHARQAPSQLELAAVYSKLECHVLLGPGGETRFRPTVIEEHFGALASRAYQAMGADEFRHEDPVAKKFAIRRFTELCLEAWQGQCDEALLGPPPDPRQIPGRVGQLLAETTKRIGGGA